MTSSRDFTADYIAARVESRSTTDVATRTAAQRKAASIARAAERAGVKIDEITLDEQARQIVLGR